MRSPGFTGLALATALVVAACGAASPPPQQTERTDSSGYVYSDDPAIGACQSNASQVLALCNAMPRPVPAGSSETLRRGYDSVIATCPSMAKRGIVGQLETCVVAVEAAALAQDPDAAARRDQARPRAELMKKDPRFVAIVAEWERALDGKNITCRDAEISQSHARECARWRGEMSAARDRLDALLVAESFDPRDFGELGLLPGDPDWRTSP